MSEIKRRFNKVLSDEISLALHRAKSLMGDRVDEYLSQYRAYRNAFIAANGVNLGKTIDQIVTPRYTLNPKYHDALKALDEAYEKLHRHRESPADFVDATIQKVVNRQLAKRPRARDKYDEIKIINDLKVRDYPNSENKKDIVKAVALINRCSESTVNRAARVGGLTRTKKSIVT